MGGESPTWRGRSEISLALATGCLHLLGLPLLGCGFSPTYPAGNPCAEDGACPPEQVCGADNLCRPASDPEATADAGSTPDAEEVSADPACATAPASSAFHLDFDDPDAPYVDVVAGELAGEAVGTVIPGDSLCGSASARFEANGTLVYPDAPLWDDVGSIDLTLRFAALPDAEEAYIFSRDASGVDEPGHLGVAVTSDGRIVMRMQNGGTTYLCTDAELATTGQWHRIGINFGEPEVELWLDGVKATYTDLAGGIDCSQRGDGLSIAGNAEPLALGAATNTSTPGTIDPHQTLFRGDLDELVVGTARKEFAR